MAGITQYTVQYDITANIAGAARGLNELKGIAESVTAPMKTAADSVKMISEQLNLLKSRSALNFTVKLDMNGFRTQIREMEGIVRAAAIRMRAELNSAFRGDPTGKTRKAGTQAFSRSVKSIESDMKDARRSIETWAGKGWNGKFGNENFKSGDIARLIATGTPQQVKLAKQSLRNQVNSLNSLVKEHAEAQKIEEKLAAQQAKKGAVGKTANTAQTGLLTNVAPAAMKEVNKLFNGKSDRTLTLTLKGVDKITPMIGEIQGKLKPLEVMLNPNTAALVEAVKAIKLPTLSVNVKPVGKGERGVAPAAKPQGTQPSGKAGEKKSAAKAQTTVAENKGVAQTVATGKKSAAQKMPVDAVFSATQIATALKAIKTPALPVHIKLMWEEGGVDKNAQLKGIAEKLPPVKLTLDISAAVAKLEEFVGMVKSSSPQNIALTATGSKPAAKSQGAASGGSVQGSKGGSGKNGHQESKSAGKKGEVISPWEKKAVGLRNQFLNSTLPFVKTQQQSNDILKFRKQFARHYDLLGGGTYAEATPAARAEYLRNVSEGINRSGQRIPSWMCKEMQRQAAMSEPATEPQRAGRSTVMYGGGGRGGVRYQKPLDARLHKTFYPLTGPTSFGARTPMAVDMAKGMGVMMAIDGAMSMVGNSFSQAMEYQNTMRTTNAILKNGTDTYSAAGFKGMEHTVRDVGIKTKFSAPEVASAARFLAMAGYDIDAINNAIRPIADLALIGDTDLGETADKMTNIMTTFGIAPEKIRQAANIMTTTATRSNTDLMMLAESAKYGGGVANMYGKNDPNLFADTMAIFGVMGNAGIQASSAGTALRMMYQNIFKPNKKQAALLDWLKSQYGIRTTDSNGGFRAMSDIIIDISKNVPQDKMASVVGSLFRITAQPGAAATINAAAEKDGSDAGEVKAGLDAAANFVEKNGVGKLVELMMVNRASVNGNISGNIAGEKQNTIQGLWAQVTSTFTEGIVRAFEGKENYFAEKLKQLRNWVANPETMQALQRLMDMLIEIGEILATFVGWWAKLYDTFPGIIKWWVTIQFALTQIGTLVSPFVSLVTVVQRLGAAIGLVNAAGGATALGAAVRPMAMAAGGRVSGAIGIAGKNALTTMTVASALDNQRRWLGASADASRRLAEVEARRKRIYKFWPKMGRAFNGGMAAANGLMTFSWLTSLWNGFVGIIGSSLMGLAKVAGMVCSPLGLAAAALAGFAVLAYKIIDGASKAKERVENIANESFKNDSELSKQHFKKGNEILNKLLPEQLVVNSVGKTVNPLQNNNEENSASNIYADVFKNWDVSATDHSNETILKNWSQTMSSDPIMRIAMGKDYEKIVAAGVPEKWISQMNTIVDGDYISSAANSLDQPTSQEVVAEKIKHRMLIGSLMREGAKNEVIAQARSDIFDVRQEYLKKQKEYDKLLGGNASQSVLQKKQDELSALQSKMELIQHYAANPARYGLLKDNQITTALLQDPNFDWRNTVAYQRAGYNALQAEIDGAIGSISGYWEGIEAMKNHAELYSNEWNDALSKILDVNTAVFNIVHNGQNHAIELFLTTTPDGNLDFTNILKQAEAKIQGFRDNMQLFNDVIKTIYNMMKQVGVDGAEQWVKNQYMENLTPGQVEDIYNKDTPEGKNEAVVVEQKNNGYAQIPLQAPEKSNPWIPDAQMGWGSVSNLPYNPVAVPMMDAGRDPTKSWCDNEYRKRQAVANYLTQQTIEQANLKNKTKDLQDNLTNTTKNGSGGGSVPGFGGSGRGTGVNKKIGGAGGNQNDYKNHYDRSAARPTQVIINIDKLANFDKTMIANGAEERDMIAAMEGRLTEAVYRVFAEAANSANHIVDNI